MIGTRVSVPNRIVTTSNTWYFKSGHLVIGNRGKGGMEVGIVDRVLDERIIAVRFWDARNNKFEPLCTFLGPLSLVYIGALVEE